MTLDPQGTPRTNGPTPSLRAADALALDHLVEAGFDPAAVPEPSRDAAHRLRDALAPIATPCPEEAHTERLVARVMERVKASRRPDLSEAVLTPMDEESLDALVQAGYQAERVPGSLRARARRASDLMELLRTSHAASEPAADLVSDTLARVHAASRAAAGRMTLPQDTAPIRQSRLRWRELASIAALLLIGFAVVWPALSYIRGEGRRAECQANLAAAGLGFSQYAYDFLDQLPLASNAAAGSPWWQVGKDPSKSNSANLFTLSRTGYVRLPVLACAGNEHGRRDEPLPGEMDWRDWSEPSYSFQNMFAVNRPNWSDMNTAIVLSDRSPIVIERDGNNVRILIPAMANSPNHDATGQSVLFSDGSARWLKSPELPSGDNIWMPGVLEMLIRSPNQKPSTPSRLDGTESPSGVGDVFVAP